MSQSTSHRPTETSTRALASIKQGIESATTAATDYSDKAAVGVREIVAFNTDTLKAFTQANQIFFAGSQDIVRQITESNHAALNETLSGFKALVAVKTAKEGLELQSNLFRSSVRRLLAESNRFALASLDLAEKVSAPLSARVSVAAEKLTPRTN
jgi:hypothetical protein